MDKMNLDPSMNSPFQVDYKAIKEYRDAKKEDAKRLQRLLNTTDSFQSTGITKSALPDLSELVKAKEQKEWTVLYYMDGCNDLEAYTANSFLDLESVGSDKNVNVVAEMGRISQEELKAINEKMGRPYEPTNIDGDWSGVRKYYVHRDKPGDVGAVDRIDSPVLEDLGQKDMSSADTLSEFLTWGIKNYPAKHYMVVLMDHGGGWTGAFTNDAAGSSGHIMSNPKIAEAFAKTQQETGVKPDVVHMAACLMASTESAYELKDATNYLVASEEMGTTLGFKYGPLLDKLEQTLADGKELTGESIAKTIVDYYADKPAAFATKSAIDMSKIDNVKNALAGFAQKLRKTDTGKEVLAEAIGKAQNFSRKHYMEFYSHTRDLASVAEEIIKSEKITDKELKESAELMIKAVKDAVIANVANVYERQTVLGQKKSDDGKETITTLEIAEGKFETSGLSVYLPTNPKYVDYFMKDGKGYKELKTSQETEWDEFIKEKFGSPPKAEEDKQTEEKS